MKIIKLELLNFMPYFGKHIIDFPVSDSHNVMLVFGDNMRGKTSILHAIRWCFYGYARGRHLKNIPNIEIINKEALRKDDYSVSVNMFFEHEKKEYDLRRSLSAINNNRKPKNNSDLDIEVMLRINGKVVIGEKIVHELNQIMPEDIARFFLFDGELLQEYEMLLDENDNQGQKIKESIEKVLGVPALINGRRDFELLLREARKIQNKDIKGIENLKSFSHKLDELNSEYDILIDDIASMENDYNNRENEIDRIERELSNTKRIQLGKDKYDQLVLDRKESDERIESLQADKLDLLKSVWKDMIQPRLKTEREKAQKKKDKLQNESNEYAIYSQKIKELQELKSKSKCPTCHQPIIDFDEKKNKEEIEKYTKKQQGLSDKMDELLVAGELLKQIDDIKPSGSVSTIIQIDKEIDSHNLKIVEMDTEIDGLDKELKKHDYSMIDKLKKDQKRLTMTNGKIEDQLDQQRKRLKQIENERSKLEHLLDENSEAQLHMSTKLVKSYEELKEIFEKSISQLRDDLRGSVSDFATKAFLKLSTEKSYKKLKVTDNYGLNIIDQSGDVVSQRSAGAEQIVALALIDGLNKTSGKKGPIIMDTPLGRLDLKHRNNVLQYIPEMAEQVVLLVHEGEIRKNEILDSIMNKVGKTYQIERVSSSKSKLVGND